MGESKSEPNVPGSSRPAKPSPPRARGSGQSAAPRRSRGDAPGEPRYKRVLLKISGDALRGELPYGISSDSVEAIAAECAEVAQMGVELALVVGGGNILRGATAAGRTLQRATADYMGMLATMINALALQDAIEALGRETRVMSALETKEVAEPYIRRRALRHLERGIIAIFAGGTGNPFFTTDTTAAVRATEIGAGVLLKATKVDGIYDRDPEAHPDARRFERIGYMDCLNASLRVMDATAVTHCMENRLPMIVFNLREKGNIRRAVLGETVGTLVTFSESNGGDARTTGGARQYDESTSATEDTESTENGGRIG